MTYFQYFLKRKTALILIVGASLMAGFGYTATQPFEYQSVVKLIVVHGNEQLDSYTASRAAERSAKTLSNVVGTTSFFENVLALDPSISDAFGANESDQRENWERSIEATVTPDTGVLTIAVYSKQPKIAEAIANASAKTISTQQWKYLGAGTSAVVEIIDAPLTSTHPVRPNILLNFISSLILGVMIAVVYVVLTTSEHV
ncbi:MAG: hypothetical protein HYZ08_01450, partial [Candidatus Kerfeldbacteria bacterium]|nr:hypothetical protein [Candidatus Kerfeldbacteria bacterium]